MFVLKTGWKHPLFVFICYNPCLPEYLATCKCMTSLKDAIEPKVFNVSCNRYVGQLDACIGMHASVAASCISYNTQNSMNGLDMKQKNFSFHIMMREILHGLNSLLIRSECDPVMLCDKVDEQLLHLQTSTEWHQVSTAHGFQKDKSGCNFCGFSRTPTTTFACLYLLLALSNCSSHFSSLTLVFMISSPVSLNCCRTLSFL